MTSTTKTANLDSLKEAYKAADEGYQLGYAAYLSGAKTYQEMKSLEGAKRRAFNKYAKAKKAAMKL